MSHALTSWPGPWQDAPARSDPAPAPAPANWCLMGDVASARGGVPEALIQWRRARGEDDPAPQLPQAR